MAKKHALSLIFIVFHLFMTFVQANEAPPLPHGPGFSQDECTAAPPNNFRVTGISTNFIALAWEPISHDAKHTLVISQQNVSGDWVHVKTIYELTGDTYIVDELQSGTQHRVAISTNCPTGETSEYVSIKDPITLIVDLMIGGRTPIKPTPIPCGNVPLNKNWIGFKVDCIVDGGSESTIFEFVFDNSGYTSLRRDKLLSTIVASNKAHEWPNCIDPIILDVQSPYKIIKLNSNGVFEDVIGRVSAVQYFDLPRIEMCPILEDPEYPWNTNYVFTALFAEKASEHDDCSDFTDLEIISNKSNFHTQNPFSETLNLFFEGSPANWSVTKICLFNVSGKVIAEQEISSFTNLHSLNTSGLPNGIYFLRIETVDSSFIVKLIKSN